MSEHILIIDDNETMREGIAATLKKEGYEVSVCATGKEGLAVFKDLLPDLVITDLKMDQVDGLEVLSQVRSMRPDTLVIVMTAFGSIEVAVEAMKRGAYDFVSKPFPGDLLRAKVKQALHLVQVHQENHRLRQEVLREKRPVILGEHPAMKLLLETLRRVAASDATVHIQGESGTGKELIAREIHRLSPRHNQPFVKTDCASLAPGILESELFGHERGAFTGAHSRKIGRFELAHHGTLFLDEIGDIGPEIQVKLLRVLQDRTFERVGGTRPIHVNVRVISATHRDLKREVAQGRFREDLYYRLNIVPVEVPPLRERSSDIVPLMQQFLRDQCQVLGRDLIWTPEAIDLLTRYPWPGNVRELENLVERLAIMAAGPAISALDIPPEYQGGQHINVPTQAARSPEGEPLSLDAVLQRLEKQMIMDAYEKAGGVKTKTAELLGIKPSALYYKLEKYGIPT